MKTRFETVQYDDAFIRDPSDGSYKRVAYSRCGLTGIQQAHLVEAPPPTQGSAASEASSEAVNPWAGCDEEDKDLQQYMQIIDNIPHQGAAAQGDNNRINLDGTIDL